MTDLEQTIDILLDVYAYSHAYKIAEKDSSFSKEVLLLLEMAKERRELNLDFLKDHTQDLLNLDSHFNFVMNADENAEQIANYILDLEVKVKNGEIIDFVRAVSPIIYRLYLRIIKKEVPDFEHLINDVKNDQYDTWNFEAMKASNHPAIQAFVSERQSRNINSSSLAKLLDLMNLPSEEKETIKVLRKFEKSVRNPLAHLIKAFDEEELNRTTDFSSQEFLNKIIELAEFSGVTYQRQPFYFDQINEKIKSYLNLKKEE